MTEKPDDILMHIPERLKEARNKRGLSLEAVANLSGVSRSMVSQVERGESSPTISTLWNLTQALQVDFAGLLEGTQAGEQIDVIRSNDLPAFDNLGQGCRIYILSPPEEAGGHEVYDIHFDNDGALSSQPHARGAREQLTVLSGSVELTSGSACETLNQGDTARYAADVPHAISTSQGPARVFLIVAGA